MSISVTIAGLWSDAFVIVILDRDGVINQDSEHYIKSPEEWQPIPGSLEAIAALKHAGHQVYVASNQSGVGRGLFSLLTLQAIHDKMQQKLQSYQASVDGIYFCPHSPEDGCDCRKPKPGLLQQMARERALDLTAAVMIGDSLRDIEAAKALAVPAILVLTGKGRTQQALVSAEVPIYPDLAAAVQALLRSSGEIPTSHWTD